MLPNGSAPMTGAKSGESRSSDSDSSSERPSSKKQDNLGDLKSVKDSDTSRESEDTHSQRNQSKVHNLELDKAFESRSRAQTPESREPSAS